MRVLFIGAAFTVVTGLVFQIIRDAQPEPYMDEIFHVPQAQRYCAGNFTEWDNKITTLPGTYLISLLMLMPLREAARTMGLGLNHAVDSFCSTNRLRLTNAALSLANFFVLYSLIERINNGKRGVSEYAVLLSAVNLATFPVLYFFSFMYYTDMASTVCVLSMYRLALGEYHTIAALLGGLSIFVRQTNIIWVFLVALQTAFGVILKHLAALSKPSSKKKNKNPNSNILDLNTFMKYGHQLVNGRFLTEFAVKCTGYALVGLSFCVFLLWNGSIVVGDKSAHQATIHGANLLYFFLVTLGFADLHLLTASNVDAFTATALRNRIACTALVIAALLTVAFSTVTHPYLLSDNRHFTFYFWSKIVNRHPWVRFALCPVYTVSSLLIFTKLDLKAPSKIVLFAVIVLGVVPQGMIEFRYFIIPYIVLRLHMRDTVTRGVCASLYLEFLFHAVINALTIYWFVAKSFVWQNEPGVKQRFMW